MINYAKSYILLYSLLPGLGVRWETDTVNAQATYIMEVHTWALK